MRRRSIAFWVSCGLMACDGAEPPPPKTPAAVSVVSQEPDVAPEPEPATLVDMVDRDAHVFGYFDAEEFRRGPLYRAFTNVVEKVPLAGDKLEDLIHTCGFNPIEALLELSLSSRVREGEPDFETAVLVARTNASPAASLDCLAELGPKLERAEVDGHPALAFGDTGGYIVAVEPFLVVGQAQTVKRALERLAGGARARVPDEVLYADLRAADLFEAERIVVSVAHTPLGTRWSVLARATSTRLAERLEGLVSEFRREAVEELEKLGLEPGAKQLATELVENLTFERRGADVAAGFGFGNPEREKAILGMATALIGERLDVFLKSENAMEARRSVLVIAGMLSEYAMKQTPPRFPESGPLVPQRVPAASRYTAVEAEWQQGGWKEIGFKGVELQPYALGFDTTAGGRKVTVRALGDLDGDGQQSLFETELQIRQGKVVGGHEVREDNPLE